jgi:hypothetical protein
MPTVGRDPARNVFEAHAVLAAGTLAIRRQVRRAQMFSFVSRLPPVPDRHRGLCRRA